jgi:hypothetical protein
VRRNQAANSISRWGSALCLPVWVAAGIVAFLPFAFDTSPWDAVLFRVPGDQGNWWHLFAAAPFFLAYPMIGLRVRVLFSARSISLVEQWILWSIVGLSISGTVAVETPFLLHLAGTSDWQRLVILGLGLGTLLCGIAVLVRRRRSLSSAQACIAALEVAYLANASLCLVVYSEATGSAWSRIGWTVTLAIVGPIALELIWILSSPRRSGHGQTPVRTCSSLIEQ